MRGLRSGYFLAAALVLVSGGSALAGEPTCDNFITSIPYTISAQGHYCLANNVATASPSGAAITVDANSVVLDLRGYKVGGQAAGVGTAAYGVYVANHSTVVIRNGLVRGFRAGVYFEDGVENNNNIVEDINADSNTVFGIYVGAGANNTIRNCIVGNTGGTTLATPPQPHGIGLFSSASFATNNTVTGTVAASPGGLEYYGLRVFAATSVRVVNNQVIGDGNTTNPSNHCFTFTGASTTIYKDNIASGCGTNYSSGIAVGTTNHP